MRDDILRAAINHFGVNNQVMKSLEEISELSTELCWFLVGKHRNIEHVIDELADVAIMVEQMKIIFGKDRVEQRIDYKLNRLETKIKEQQCKSTAPTAAESIIPST